MKKAYKSKTIWFNVLALCSLLLNSPELANLVPVSPETMLSIVGIGNIILRSVTKTGISVKGD